MTALRQKARRRVSGIDTAGGRGSFAHAFRRRDDGALQVDNRAGEIGTVVIDIIIAGHHPAPRGDLKLGLKQSDARLALQHSAAASYGGKPQQPGENLGGLACVRRDRRWHR